MAESRAQIARDRGLADMRMLTIAAVIGAGAMTLVFAVIAAATNPGHSDAQAATGAATGDDGSTLAAPGVFAPSNGQPYVVTGGSH